MNNSETSSKHTDALYSQTLCEALRQDGSIYLSGSRPPAALHSCKYCREVGAVLHQGCNCRFRTGNHKESSGTVDTRPRKALSIIEVNLTATNGQPWIA